MIGKNLESMDDRSYNIGLRLRSLFMEFQSLQGSNNDDELSGELKTFLAWVTAEWHIIGGSEKEFEIMKWTNMNPDSLNEHILFWIKLVWTNDSKV